MRIQRILDAIETAGNRLPTPAVLFVILCFMVLGLSGLARLLSLHAVHPVSGDTIHAVNLISVSGLHRIISEAVTNFTSFAPVGTVLVAIMGVGVAEHSGLLNALLRVTILRAPGQLLTFTIVIAGVLSSLAADTGYVVLIPLAAMVFAGAGRHPVAGIAAAFAGVSGGFAANLMVGPIDALLAGISTEAAVLVQPDYEVNAAGNFYFMIVSTFVIALIGTWVTEKIVSPRLSGKFDDGQEIEQVSVQDK
ncbi:MAG: AbgT family transporter, partial [Pseudohongiellaceae bacterium]